MSNVKLCAVTTVPVTMTTFVIPMMDYLQSNGYEVTLLCTMDQGFLEKHQSRFQCVSVPMKRGVDVVGSLAAIWKMFCLFRRMRFDMVQYATPNAALYASVAAFFARVPRRVYCQWGIRYVGCDGVQRLIFKMMEKITCALSTHIRPASPKNLQFAVAEKLYKTEKADVVGRGGTIGVDLKRFDIDKKNDWRREIRDSLSFENDIVFGFVGSIRPDKGCNELLKAFRKVLESNSSCRLLLLGDEFSEDPLDSELREWSLKCPQIRFAGRVIDTERYMAAMDILVHPSYREGFSMVIQEAAAFALPVITTDIPGPSEVIDKDVTGLLVPARDAESLHAAMVLLMNDSALRERMGKAGLERDRNFFERSIMLEKVLEDRNRIMEETI